MRVYKKKRGDWLGSACGAKNGVLVGSVYDCSNS